MTALSRLHRYLRLAHDRRRAVRAEMRRAEAERRAVAARLRDTERTSR